MFIALSFIMNHFLNFAHNTCALLTVKKRPKKRKGKGKGKRPGFKFMPDASFSGDSPDDLLLRRFQSGQEDAATQLYARYAARLLDLAQRRTGHDLNQRVDPEDVVQSVFRTFFRRAAEGSYQVPDGDTLWKLLMVITLNKIRSLADYHRADKRDVRRTEGIQANDNDPRAQDSLEMLRMTIDDLTRDLPDTHRKMIHLRIEGFTVTEIADRVERSKRSTERVLQTFRSQLLSQLRDAGMDDDDLKQASPELVSDDKPDDHSVA